MANKLLIFTRLKMKNFFLVILLLVFGTGFASAQKDGYIDSDYILNLMPEYTLAKDKLDKLAKTLKTNFSKDVKINATVDQTLIGGMIVKVGSRMIDTTIQAKLNSLQNVMKEVG